MRRCLALGFLFAVLSLSARAQGALPCSEPGGGLTVRGRVVGQPPGQAGVHCCYVEVTIAPGVLARAFTGLDGSFRVCFDQCPASPTLISAVALNCSATAEVMFQGCDPALPGAVVNLGDLTSIGDPDYDCLAPVRGTVLCRSGALLEPVVDCAIDVDDHGQNGWRVTTRTDANGDYGACVLCDIDGVARFALTAQCCDITQEHRLVPVGEPLQVPTMICDPCPVPPCPVPTDIEIRGRLACDADGDGNADPVVGCDVTLGLQRCGGGAALSVTVTTDASGDFSACVRCPGDEQCGDWTLSVASACCPGPRTFSVASCPPVFDTGTLTCCPGGGLCGPTEAIVRGRVTCVDPALPNPRPMNDCLVDLNACGRRVRVRTDANGDYSACVPCVGCGDVVVASSCCGGILGAPISCGGETIVDLSCDCPVPLPCPGEQEVRGRVTCVDAGGLPQPVAGCAVIVGCPGETVVVTTDANGDYLACLPCDACPDVIVTPLCCNASTVVTASPNCTPLTANVDCGACPVAPPCPGEQEVRGRVTCLDAGGAPQPVAGCDVLLSCPGVPGISVTVTTDANGLYVGCLPCNACNVVVATALCCNASAQATLDPNCTPVTADISCGACTPLPDPCSPEQTIAGRVTCDVDGDGAPDPLPGCAVRVECLGVPGFDVIVTTDADGEYVACIPCTTCTTARVTALCCGQSATITLTPPDCVPVQADIACINCPPPSPCAAPEQEILGRVTCLDAGGLRQPMAGCDVRIECAGQPSVTVTTDPNGDYSACLPCGACAFAVVTPLCCGSPVTVQLDPARCLPVRQDVDCGACVPPRPCPGPPATLVSGTLLCTQGNDQAPLASCVVILQALDALGNPLPGVATALTDGAGQYQACMPCPNGIASIRATAQCCNASIEVPAGGCPETLSLGTMLCNDCSPCPAGTTRLQGQIQCRGGGPVADCAIRVVVTTCDETLVLDGRTDRNGKYRLCVPCPCDDSNVRVTALCCNASRAFHVDRCGPVTPMPTLYCPSPCR